MKLCPKCGAQAQNDARFCKNCAYGFSASGAEATIVQGQMPAQGRGCPNCGSPIIPGATMCTNCAAPLAGPGMTQIDYGQYRPGRGGILSGPNRKTILIASIAGGVLLLTGLIVMIVLLAGGSGPGSVVKDVVYAVEKNDDRKAYDLSVKEVQNQLGPQGMKQTTNILSQAISRRQGISSVSILKEETDQRNDKLASVNYKIAFKDNGDPAEYTALVFKEDGNWKIISLGTNVW